MRVALRLYCPVVARLASGPVSAWDAHPDLSPGPNFAAAIRFGGSAEEPATS
jgi:hypothetical protein